MSVLHPWVEALTLMQQSVLISAIRAPDGLSKSHVSKNLWRWLRRCVLYSAFDKRVLKTPDEPGGGSFTGPVLELGKTRHEYLRAVDEVPHHAHLHLLHAAEILGYKHPTEGIRNWWREFYEDAAKDMHLHVETEAEMDYRLADVREQWLQSEAFPA